MAKKKTYEDAFSGSTKAIVRTLTNICLDLSQDIMQRHMFGHKAFLIRGNMFCMVGEWPRKKLSERRVDWVEGKKRVPTLILPVIDPAFEAELMLRKDAAYFAPGGTRLKNWISFEGDWLTDESQLQPVILRQFEIYRLLPAKKLKNAGTVL